ncbi:MAG: hypothetical protein LGR52_15365 [Candidatus Thiosymbion ectosymbiont of Robbea hypermnestra]|nr:hypothetical protein [Candidatus Thiosymbion ectosymbiont of Robbea hypermnestra]
MRTLDLRLLVAVAALLWAGAVASQSQRLKDIGNFVQEIYTEGIPFEQASRYSGSVVPRLLRMLKSPGKQDSWPNIVTTLGMIGDKRAVGPIIEFIEKGAGTWNRSRKQAQKSAIVSLGYLINLSGDQDALDYLIRRAFLWLSPPRGSGSDKNLGKYAIQGLALSGNRKAAKALESLQNRLRSKDPLHTDLEEALRTNREIAKKGLVKYHRESQLF